MTKTMWFCDLLRMKLDVRRAAGRVWITAHQPLVMALGIGARGVRIVR